MKRIISILMVISAGLVSITTSHAQSAADMADRAFALGKYSDAAQLYESAATMTSNQQERNRLYDLVRKCKTCRSLRSNADKLYKENNYEEALAAYKKLLAQNAKDPVAVDRVRELPGVIERIKLAALEEAERKVQEEKAAEEAQMKEQKRLAEEREREQESVRETEELKRKQEQEARQKAEEVAALLAKEREEARLKAAENNKKKEKEEKEESVFQVFQERPSLARANQYLSTYPQGKHTNQVKDWLVHYYCGKHQYNNARAYAYSNELKEFVYDEELRYTDELRDMYAGAGTATVPYKKEADRSHMVQLGVGFEADMWKDILSYGVPVQLKFGRSDQVVNLLIGGYYGTLTGWGRKQNDGSLVDWNGNHTQVITSTLMKATAEIRLNAGPVYLGGGAAYCFNQKPYYQGVSASDATNRTINLSVNGIVNPNNLTFMGTFGFNLTPLELGFYVLYNYFPTYNLSRINTDITYDYDDSRSATPIGSRTVNFYEVPSIANQVVGKIRAGVVLKYYLFSGK